MLLAFRKRLSLQTITAQSHGGASAYSSLVASADWLLWFTQINHHVLPQLAPAWSRLLVQTKELAHVCWLMGLGDGVGRQSASGRMRSPAWALGAGRRACRDPGRAASIKIGAGNNRWGCTGFIGPSAAEGEGEKKMCGPDQLMALYSRICVFNRTTQLSKLLSKSRRRP